MSALDPFNFTASHGINQENFVTDHCVSAEMYLADSFIGGHPKKSRHIERLECSIAALITSYNC